ncbi:MAG: biotin/lipoyl-binding protein [Eubacteriales bacterium]|nr:biotin/lipoyl-binding protein [Eubacteriales bacterium]
MKKFTVKVNGIPYEVEVEELTGNGSARQSVPAVSQPLSSQPLKTTVPATGDMAKAAEDPVAETKQAPAATEQAPNGKVSSSVPAGAETVTAPMPGTILKVNVSSGDQIKKGQVLLILEAMKMENEIVSPHDAVVSSVNTAKGSSVNAGDVLLSLAKI